MSPDQSSSTSSSTSSSSTEELQEQIEQTREELADTVDALTAKADVKRRTKEKVARIKAAGDQLTGRAPGARPREATSIQAGFGAMLAAVTAVVVRRRRA